MRNAGWALGLLVRQNLDPREGREENGVLEDVVPRHSHAAERLSTTKAHEVAAAKLDPLETGARERHLAQLTALEDDVLQRRAAEVALAHPAVAEDDPFERCVAEADEVDPALIEDEVTEGRFGELGAGQPAAQQLDPAGREPESLAARLVHVPHDDVDEISELDLGRRVVAGIRRVGSDRRLGH